MAAFLLDLSYGRESLARLEPLERDMMNWEQLQGDAKQFSGKVKQQWAKLTDDDLLLLKGKKETFLGKLQERIGVAKDEAEKQFDAFMGKVSFDKKPSMPSPK